MRLSIYIIISLGLSFFLSNCGETFSTVVEVDPPEFERQMTVSSIIQEGDTLLNFFVGQNKSIFNSGGIDDYGLSKAKVMVRNVQSGVELQAVDNSTSFTYNYQIEDVDSGFFSPNEDYVFVVEHPDFELSSTMIKMPPASDVLENITYKRNDGIDSSDEGITAQSSVSFDIVDDSSAANYYELEMIVPTSFGPRSLFLITIDPTGVEGYPNSNLFFSDETFDGQTKNIKVSFDRMDYDPAIHPFIELTFRSLDKGSYDFIRSLRRHKDTEDQPFLSPVQLLSNVNNALGNITLKTETIYEVK